MKKLFTLLTSIAIAGVSFAQVLDQTQTVQNTTLLVKSPAAANARAQSWTCGLTGQLQKIDFKVGAVTTAGSYTFKIFNGAGTAGLLLYSTTVSISTPATVYTITLGTTIAVTSGSVYTWELSSSGTAKCFVGANTTNPYTSGTAYFAGTAQPANDLYFSTYVNTVPITQLLAQYCNSTLTSLSQQIYCTPVSGATDYRWRFICSAQGFNQTIYRGSGSNNFIPSWQTGIQNNRTYTVEVAAKVGTQWGLYITICNLSTPTAVQTTKVANPNCPGTTAAVSTTIYCNPVTGATNYRWRVTNTSLGFSSEKYRGAGLTDWKLSWNTGTLTNTAYDVEVAGLVGSTWGAYATICVVTTGPLPIEPNDQSSLRIPFEVLNANPGMTDSPALSMNIFPNPSPDGNISVEFGLDQNADHNIQIEIFDMVGKMILSERMNNTNGEAFTIQSGTLAKGIYSIRASNAQGSNYGKIVVE